LIENKTATIVIPAKNEGTDILPVLKRLQVSLDLNVEFLIVVDSENDTTVNYVREFDNGRDLFRVIINDQGRGPAYAIRTGINNASSEIIVVTMADGSDDPKCIGPLISLVERGVAIACASRYMPGGQQIGAPFLKSHLSKFAGKSLKIFTRVGTSDATNSFKAYSLDFIKKVEIESKSGFEMGIELVAKAIRYHDLVAEVPTIWIERDRRNSNFKMKSWIPKYLRWYFYALMPKRKI
jgi:glycosyltransferase involved in cell wall biosynthesis